MTDDTKFNGWENSNKVPNNEIAQSYSEMQKAKQANIHAADGTNFQTGQDKEISEKIEVLTAPEVVEQKTDEQLRSVRVHHLAELRNRGEGETITARILESGH
jgi:hypothetical protein